MCLAAAGVAMRLWRITCFTLPAALLQMRVASNMCCLLLLQPQLLMLVLVPCNTAAAAAAVAAVFCSLVGQAANFITGLVPPYNTSADDTAAAAAAACLQVCWPGCQLHHQPGWAADGGGHGRHNQALRQ
jgi:hypothetical protein